ncbi:uncharacterized protein C8R40DRAFT_1128268, partial [Lentinula edodes]|uniref:uncharacterized protein n=1 Tax=Lentinula edodes TaxID=5353 RepID=UPI001E8DB6B0
MIFNSLILGYGTEGSLSLLDIQIVTFKMTKLRQNTWILHDKWFSRNGRMLPIIKTICSGLRETATIKIWQYIHLSTFRDFQADIFVSNVLDTPYRTKGCRPIDCFRYNTIKLRENSRIVILLNRTGDIWMISPLALCRLCSAETNCLPSPNRTECPLVNTNFPAPKSTL